MNQTEKAFCFTVAVLLFQITRNINLLVYTGILMFGYTWLYTSFFLRNKKMQINNKRKLNPAELLFIITLIWIPFNSILNMSLDEFVTAFPRFFVTFPFIFFCFIYNQYNFKLLRKVQQIVCVFLAISSLTIPFQIIFGKVSFFASSGEREGLERFASLAGSLTSMGTLGALSLAFLLFNGNFLFSKVTKNLLIIITVSGMFMSLQKAAIINVIICLILYLISLDKKKMASGAFGILLLVGVLFGLFNLFKESLFGIYINNIFIYSFSESSLGAKADLMDRLLQYPLIVADYNNINLFGFFVGIGLKSLSGTVGLPYYPMSHNNYFDLLYSGGLIHLLSYLFLLFRIPLTMLMKLLRRRIITNLDKSYSAIVILFLINMLIGAANFYQPIASVIIFIVIFSYSNLKMLNEEEIVIA